MEKIFLLQFNIRLPKHQMLKTCNVVISPFSQLLKVIFGATRGN